MKCRSCDRPNVAEVIETRGMKIGECKWCGLVQILGNPPVTWNKQYRAVVPAETKSRAEGYVVADSWPLQGNALLNYLEHLPSVSEALMSVSGTTLLVEVPNFGRAYREQLVTEFCPEHLSYFTPATLATALAINGWIVDDMVLQEGGHTISCKAHRRPTIDLEWVNTKKIAEPEGRYTVWGAGHHALAAIEAFGWNPSAIVDSDPNKWGMRVGTTVVRQPPPPKGCIVVACAGYSEEIAESLDQPCFILGAKGLVKWER